MGSRHSSGDAAGGREGDLKRRASCVAFTGFHLRCCDIAEREGSVERILETAGDRQGFVERQASCIALTGLQLGCRDLAERKGSVEGSLDAAGGRQGGRDWPASACAAAITPSAPDRP